MDIWGDTNIDFLGKRKAAFALSMVLAVMGLLALVSISLGKAKLGTDFAGGIAVQFRFERPFDMEEVRKVLDQGGFGDAELQEFADSSKLLVRLSRTEGELSLTTAALGAALTSGFPLNPYIIDSTTEIGPTVGKKLQKDALWAVVVSLFGILLYVAWRFELRFGVAAVVATFHDVIAVLGILTIMGKEINLLIVTALLTLAGYSLTDSVVVFDRIRENIKKRTKEGLESLINRSINEVLRRTIVTSGTTLMVLLALLTRGGEVIHDFAFTLALGVVVGTYSSIFVASPLVFIWRGKKGKLIKASE